MRRLVALAFLLAGVLLITGCGRESTRQAGARVAVEGSLRPSVYDVGRTHCTDNPSPWFVEHEATVFICVARRRDGSCDWYRATLKNAGWEVALEQRHADCVLPF
jgi:hypothetical protein